MLIKNPFYRHLVTVLLWTVIVMCTDLQAQPFHWITVQTSPVDLEYRADSFNYEGSSMFYWVEGSSHTLQAFSPQSGGSNIRYVYVSWSDGGAQTHTYIVPASDATVTANFKTQYYLIINSIRGSPTGAGWYDANTTAYFSVTSPDVQGSTRYVFQNWSGHYNGTSPSGSIVMNSAKNIQANWKTEYLLTIQSPHGNPVGAGWYEENTVANFSVSKRDTQGDTRYVFQSWSGDYSGTNESASLVMNGPKTVVASWETEYFLNVLENPDVGGDVMPPPPGEWYNAGQIVSVEAFPNTASDYDFENWSGDLSGSVNPQSITMSGPKSVTANFSYHGLTRITTNPEGLAIIVDGSPYNAPQDFAWSYGSSHTIGVDSPQIPDTSTQYIFHSWSDNGEQSHEITVGDTTTYIARFGTWYYLYTSAEPEEGGTMTPAPPGAWFEKDSRVRLQAYPDTDNQYSFAGWQGDLISMQNPDSVSLTGPMSVSAHFVCGDSTAPEIFNCCPPPGSKSVPRNSRIYFDIQDPVSGLGIDISTLQFAIDGTAVIADGVDQTDGHVHIENGTHSCHVEFIPPLPVEGNESIQVSVEIADNAIPPNIGTKEYSLSVSDAVITETMVGTVDSRGGILQCDSTGLQMIFSANAVDDTTEVIISLSDGHPELPDTVNGLGLCYHFWPEGLQFAGSVHIRIPYTNSDLADAGVSDPMDLPVFYYSTILGEWTQLAVLAANNAFVEVAVDEFCFLIFTDASVSGINGEHTDSKIPTGFVLSQNYPNPFNPVTTISYELPEKSVVSVKIFSVTGSEILTMVDEEKSAGHYETVWQACDKYGRPVGSGIYFYQLKAGDYKKIRKMLLVR